MADNSVAGLKARYGERWRWLVVFTVVIGTMAMVLSATVVNVALHDIMLEFGLSQGQVHWAATGFIAAMTTTMLASSWVVDRVGVRVGLGFAMAAFTLISVAGGFADTAGQLIAARIGQGAVAGLIQPMGMFLIFRIFPTEQRGQAMGIYGMGVILAPALGPVLGGFLVDQFNWRYVMYAPAPVTLLGVWMAWRFLPRPSVRTSPYPFDFAGLALLGGSIALTLDTLTRLQALDGQEARILLQAALLPGLLAAFLYRERTARYPLVKLELLRRPVFVYACLGSMAMGLALFGSTYLIPLFVQTTLGFSATEAGLLMLPAGVVLGVTFPLAGRLADRQSPRGLILFGLGVFAFSAVLFATTGHFGSFAMLAVWAVLGRIGIGFMLPAVSTGALNPLPPELMGAGSGTVNFARQLGGALGINVVALTIEFGEHQAGVATFAAFQWAWWLVAVFVALAAVPVWKMRDRSRCHPQAD